jgi:hypothetical protein
MLTKEQVDAVADAVMADGKERQRERANQRDAEQRWERTRRRWAIGIILLMLVGAVVARMAGVRVPLGILGGGLVGQLVALSRGAWRTDVDAAR